MKPKFTAEEEKLIAETVAIGLEMQHKFRPEPLFKHTGKGYMRTNTVAEIALLKEQIARSKGARQTADSSAPEIEP